MNITEFILKFAEQFRNTPISNFAPTTIFWDLDEWSSLTALSVVSMIKEEYGVILYNTDIKGVKTIQELYELVRMKEGNTKG